MMLDPGESPGPVAENLAVSPQRKRSSMKARILLVFAAAWCVAAMAPVAAQQASQSARGTAISPAPAPPQRLPGPRLAPQFQGFEPRFTRVETSRSSSGAAVDEGGQHTIVISTLALVLAAVIVVLLAVR